MGAFCSDCIKSITNSPTSSSLQYETISTDDNRYYQDQNNSSLSSNTTTATPMSSINGQYHENNNHNHNNNNHNNNHNNNNLSLPTANNNNSNISTIPSSGFFLKYDLKDVIGVGSTANCHRCCRKSDDQEFACKVIDKRQIEVKFTGLLDQFYVEIKVLSELNHPNIIKLEDVYETSDRIFIVMELMSGGELFDYVVEKGTLSELEASRIVRKITSAIALMHSLGIIHRDLKPENLLLTSKGPNAEVKLIDFGLAKKISNDAVAHSFLGTRGYLAPEMLQRHTYDKAIDIWALGIIVFVLLCGCLPFDDDSSRITSEMVARKKFALRFPRWAQTLSPSAKDLLQRLLDVNPKTRITAEEAEKHPWVRGEVAPDNYLTSPSILGERRKELKSPMTPHMQTMHNRLMEANNASSNPPNPNNLTSIREEQTGGGGGAGAGGGGAKKSNQDRDFGQANYGATQTAKRKNSI